MKPKLMLLLLLPLMAAGGCATVPTGPSVRVLPGTGKTFEQFQADDAVCRQWADQHVGQSSQETVNQNTATGAAVGTLGGAALGAIFGAASGHAGTGAAIGAGSGLLLGTIAGANAGQAYGMEAQRRYDMAYEQCMYAKGNSIPGGVAPASSPPVATSPAAPRVAFQAAPRFIYSPALGFYVAVDTPYDLVYYDGRYFLWSNGFWYDSPYYHGPWVVVRSGGPSWVHRYRYQDIRRYRDREYRAFLHDRDHYHGRWYVPGERRAYR